MYICGEICNSKITDFANLQQVNCTKTLLKAIISDSIDIYYLK